MIFGQNDIFDTPRFRYNQLKEKFERKYLNPKAWDYQCDTKEIIKAYQDLLNYLEETEAFRSLSRSLLTDIPTDNVNLVLSDLPFPLKRREELIEFIVSGNQCDLGQEEELCKIKEFFEMKMRGSMVGFDRKRSIEQGHRRASLLRKYKLNEYSDESKDVEDLANKDAKYKELSQKKFEILDNRQKIYAKLNKGENVTSLFKNFKRKVEEFSRNFRAELSYDEEKSWRDKIIITEKAVIKREKEMKAAKECSRESEHLAPSVKEVFDAARAQELIIENLPKPPDIDEIEEKLDRLKEFNKKLLDDKNKNAAKKEGKLEVAKIKTDTIQNVKEVRNDTEGNQIKTFDTAKKEDFFDVDEFLGKNLFWSNDSSNSTDSEDEAEENYYDEAKENENEQIVYVDESDEYKAEVNEFNVWYYKKLEERMNSKATNKNTKNFYDKIAQNSEFIDVQDVNDDLMYKQVFDGELNKDEVDKSVAASKIVPLLQAIFAMLLVSGKTIHEQSLQINRLSKLSQPSLLSHLQPEAPLSLKSPCFYQTQPRVCCKVTNAFIVKVSSMVSTASSGVLWWKRVYSALECVKMKTVRAAKVRLVNLLGLGEVILELANEDY